MRLPASTRALAILAVAGVIERQGTAAEAVEAVLRIQRERPVREIVPDAASPYEVDHDTPHDDPEV